MGATSLKDQSIYLDWPLRKNGTTRKCLLSCMVLTFIITFFYYTQFNFHNLQEELVVNLSRPASEEVKYLIHTSNCRIPNDDPFNEEIKPFYRKESYVPCSTKPLLTYIEKKESKVTLHINDSLLHTYSFFKIYCCYSNITRVVTFNKSDDEVRFSDCKNFEKSVIITHPLVLVKCHSFVNSDLYSNVHAVINFHDASPAKIRKNYSYEKTPYSVVFVGIDSVSKMNLIRTMPKSHKFLEDHKFFNLRGYTKIADNTFPNLIAILTGKTWIQVYDECDPSKNRMNDCDIIWKKFNQLGYITAYAEDVSIIGTFNYNRKGFSDPPTDFYFRPYTIAAEKLRSIRSFGMQTCSGPETSGERIMNLVKEFTLTFEKYPKFGLFWMNSFSHDNVNAPSAMDDKVELFLKDIYDHLENTFLVVFSDHGFRFGNIRYTHTGWLEERLPFIYIHIPPNFKKNHPTKFKNFVTNTKRLTTPYDIHMTLQDLLVLNSKTYKVVPSLACPKCHSLFKEIAESRSCRDCAIEQHWCMCSGHSYINRNEKIAIDTAEFVIKEVNLLIGKSKNANKCAIYTFKKVIFAGMSEKYLNEKNQSVNYLLVMFETQPPAMFEATVELAYKSNYLPSFRLLGEVSRTNRYKDNSHCIDDDLKKYCYCDGYFTSIKSAICNIMNCV